MPDSMDPPGQRPREPARAGARVWRREVELGDGVRVATPAEPLVRARRKVRRRRRPCPYGHKSWSVRIRGPSAAAQDLPKRVCPLPLPL